MEPYPVQAPVLEWTLDPETQAPEWIDIPPLPQHNSTSQHLNEAKALAFQASRGALAEMQRSESMRYWELPGDAEALADCTLRLLGLRTLIHGCFQTLLNSP